VRKLRRSLASFILLLPVHTSNDTHAHALQKGSATNALPEPTKWLRVSRISLIRQEVREYVPDGNLKLLFAEAEHVVEGALDREGKGFASVMTTICLERTAELFREHPDEATTAKLVDLLREDTRVRARLIAVGRAEFERRGDTRARDCRAEMDVHLRFEESRLLIDGDLVLLLGQPERRRRGAR